MAIDKNSKAYQNLLNSGYTDEQITQMHSDVAGGQSTQQAVANTTPVNTPNYENQGSGNYVYNEATGYYENQNAPKSTQTTPEIKQETVVKQQETVGSTVPEIKQEGALKPLSQDYYNQTGDMAQKQIRDNLNSYRETNPGLFSSYEDFKRNFSYNARNEEQRNTLDAWYGEYEKGMQLSGVPVIDLYTQYKDGQVSTSDLETLKVYNPTKYAELQAQINKGNIVAAYDDDKGQDQTPKTIQEMAYEMAMQTFNQFMSGDSSSGASNIFREYEDKMNDPEMLALSDQCTEVQEQMENIQSDLDSIKKQVEAEYAGTGATRSKINAIISDRSYDLQLQLRTLNSEYNKYATQYNNRMQQYQTEFSMQLQEYQINQQERNQKMDELGFALDLMNFETNDQKAEREWNYWVKQQEYANGNINSSDYQTRYKAALNSVQNLLAQYPNIPMVRSAEQMADDILKAIDGGSNLGAELTKINKQIQQKPEYKYLYNNTFKPATSTSGLQSYQVGDTEYVVYNGEMMTADDFNKRYGGKATGATGTAKPYDIVDARALSADMMSTIGGYDGNTLGLFLADANNQQGKTGGWCGAFVNKYLKSIGVTNGNYYDDNLETKLNSVNSQIPKVGSIAVFDYGHITKETGKNHGHVGIVTKVYEDGSYDVIDSNFDSDKKIKVRTHLNPQSSNCKGFFDPSQPPAGSGDITTESAGATLFDQGTSSSYIESEVGLYDAYINNGTTPTDAKLKSLGNGDLNVGWQVWNARVQDYMNKTGVGTLQNKKTNEVNKLRTEMHQQSAYSDYNQMQTSFQKIKDNTNNSTATAASDVALLFNFMKMLDPKSIVRESEFKTAQNMGSLPEQWHAKLKSAINGKKLTDKQRNQIYEEAAGLMDGATYLYNNLLDDYAGMIQYGGDASNLGKRGVYITDEYINMYGNPISESISYPTSTNTSNTAWVYQLPLTGGFNLGLTNVGGYYFPSTF